MEGEWVGGDPRAERDVAGSGSKEAVCGDQKRDFDSVRRVGRRADKAKEGIEWTKRGGYGNSDNSVTDISK